MVTFVVWIVFILLEQNPNLNCIKEYEKAEILEFNQYQKYDKAPFIFYS